MAEHIRIFHTVSTAEAQETIDAAIRAQASAGVVP
jgi:hypothetical protein